jgi:hypothetical protein
MPEPNDNFNEKEDSEDEIQIVLPELHFKKMERGKGVLFC